jgi:hypothetical protein
MTYASSKLLTQIVVGYVMTMDFHYELIVKGKLRIQCYFILWIVQLIELKS